MGASYANIVIKGVSQKQIVDFLTVEGRDAWVAPTVNEITVVYDSELKRGGDDSQALRHLTASLSQEANCVALGVSVYDSDILQYMLYQSGELIDTYSSAPNYWYSGSANALPEGGDAVTLCAAFGIISSLPPIALHLPDWNPSLFEEYDNRIEFAAERIKSTFSSHPIIFRVNQTLHSHSCVSNECVRSFDKDDELYTLEEERHADLANALGLPSFAVCAGYEMFGSKGPLVELAKLAMTKVGSQI